MQLSSECESSGTELVLAHATTASYRRRLQRLFPHLRLAAVTAETPLTDLRQRGAEVASGDILILIDDAIAAESLAKTALPTSALRTAEQRDATSESLDAQPR
jgi:hypothetical protein